MCYSNLNWSMCYRRWIAFGGLLKSGHNKRRFWSFWRGLTKLKIYIQGGLSDLGGGDKNTTVVKSKLRHLLCNTSGLCYSEMYSFIWTLSYNITLIAHRRAWTSLIAIFLLAYRLASGGAGYIKVEEGRLEKEWRGWNKVGKVETTWREGTDKGRWLQTTGWEDFVCCKKGRPGISHTFLALLFILSLYVVYHLPSLVPSSFLSIQKTE